MKPIAAFLFFVSFIKITVLFPDGNYAYPSGDSSESEIDDHSDILTGMPEGLLSGDKREKIIYHFPGNWAQKRSVEHRDAERRHSGHMRGFKHIVLSSGTFKSSQAQYFLDDADMSYPTVGEQLKTYQEYRKEFDVPTPEEPPLSEAPNVAAIMMIDTNLDNGTEKMDGLPSPTRGMKIHLNPK